MSDIEVRPFAEPVEVRSAAGGRLVLTGTAIRYGARSRDIGGFRERVMPGAARELIKKADVLAFEEHRSERYLGRTGNATLRLLDSKESLQYEVDLPDTTVGREVAALAERGDYKGSSFGFRALTETWANDDDGFLLRTITKFGSLRDVGPTVCPAYEDSVAEVALRHLAADRGIEVRSVLEAARTGLLGALLLDGDPKPADPKPADPEPAQPVIEDEPVTDTDPVIHRRPVHWFF